MTAPLPRAVESLPSSTTPGNAVVGLFYYVRCSIRNLIMLGMVLIFLGIAAIVFGAYRMGASTCDDDVLIRDNERNTSFVVIAIALMFAMSGVLMLVSGTANPFDALTPASPSTGKNM
jgi:hypothetical protein